MLLLEDLIKVKHETCRVGWSCRFRRWCGGGGGVVSCGIVGLKLGAQLYKGHINLSLRQRYRRCLLDKPRNTGMY